MSGNYHYTHERGSSGPVVVNRDPIVIDRVPAEAAHRRTVSDSRNPSGRRTYRIYNLLGGRRRDSDIVVQTTTSTTRHRGGGVVDTLTSPTTPSRRTRRSSPPQPAVIVQPRTRSLSPFAQARMPAPHGQSGHVPLPPRIPPEDNPSPDRGNRGRGSRDSRRPQTSSRDPDMAEDHSRRRSPRRYQMRPSQDSDPRRTSEQVLEPSSPRVHFEVVQPNEPIRSREVRSSKEYIELKAVAERNKEAAQDAAQRCASAEVRVQNMQQKLAESIVRENKAVDESEQWRRETIELKRELERVRAELDNYRREHHTTTRERDLAERELQQERQQRRDSARDNSGSGSGNNSGNGHGRARRRVVIRQDRGDRRDEEPRTPADARLSTTSANAAPTTTTRTPRDVGMDAINQARAEAANLDRRYQRSSS